MCSSSSNGLGISLFIILIYTIKVIDQVEEMLHCFFCLCNSGNLKEHISENAMQMRLLVGSFRTDYKPNAQFINVSWERFASYTKKALAFMLF